MKKCWKGNAPNFRGESLFLGARPSGGQVPEHNMMDLAWSVTVMISICFEPNVEIDRSMEGDLLE